MVKDPVGGVVKDPVEWCVVIDTVGGGVVIGPVGGVVIGGGVVIDPEGGVVMDSVGGVVIDVLEVCALEVLVETGGTKDNIPFSPAVVDEVGVAMVMAVEGTGIPLKELVIPIVFMLVTESDKGGLPPSVTYSEDVPIKRVLSPSLFFKHSALGLRLRSGRE